MGMESLGVTTYGYGPSGAVGSVSGNGNTASYFHHPQQRTLENVTYTKDGEAGPMLQSTRKHDAANRLTRITTHVNDAGVQKYSPQPRQCQRCDGHQQCNAEKTRTGRYG